MSFEFYGFGYLPLELSKHKIPTLLWIDKKNIRYIFGGKVFFLNFQTPNQQMIFMVFSIASSFVVLKKLDIFLLVKMSNDIEGKIKYALHEKKSFLHNTEKLEQNLFVFLTFL